MKVRLVCAIMVSVAMLCGCEVPVSKPPVPASVAKYQEKALEIVYASLSDPSGLIRAHAVEVVATIRRKDMMEVVVKLLKDESVEVRFSAAMAIVDTGYARGVLSVKRLLADPDINVRIAAAYALTKLKKAELSQQIYAALGSRDETVRANAVLLLGKLGDRKAIKALNAAANDAGPDSIVSIQAAESIAMLGGDTRTYQKLWAFLISKFIEDRAVGIRGMAALNTPESRNAILNLMLTDESVEIRLLAAEQLGRLGTRTGEKDVLDYLNQVRASLDPESRQQADLIAVMAIGRIGGTKLAAFLPNFLVSNSKDMRLQAAQAVLLLNRR